jgi:hypothetical protein
VAGTELVHLEEERPQLGDGMLQCVRGRVVHGGWVAFLQGRRGFAKNAVCQLGSGRGV